MRAMRAESFTGYGGLKLIDVPRPTLAAGRVLVRITAAGVSPLDHTILSGGHPGATAPLILGNEGAGVVEDPGDSSFPVGTRVMFCGSYGVSEDGTMRSGSLRAPRICARSPKPSTTPLPEAYRSPT
jgi:NADPH2:quinone reductase